MGLNPEDLYAPRERPAETVSTGILGIDLLLHGGWQPGRLVEVLGGERSGKSTIAYCSCAAFQQASRPTAWISATRGGFVTHYARGCGIALDRLVVVQLKTANEALNVAADLCEMLDGGLVVLDELSRAATNEESASAMAPRLTKERAHTISALCAKHRSTLLMLSDPELAWRAANTFWIWQQLRVTAPTPREMEVLALRTPRGFLGSRVTVPLLPERGVDHPRHLLRLATTLGVVENRHAHYYFRGEGLGYGQRQASERLGCDDALAGAIRDGIAAAAGERLFRSPQNT